MPETSASVPFWTVLALGAVLFGALDTCRQEAADLSNWTDCVGRPLDWAGDRLYCPDQDARHPPDATMYQFGKYRYRCITCGLVADVRRDLRTGYKVWRRE
jgi:hypothetical protein